MRALGIRKWMLLGMGMFLFLPALAYGTTTVLDQHVFGRSQTAQQHTAAEAIMLDAATSASNWRDPAWRRTLQGRLTAVDSGILIQDPTGAEILRAGHISNGARGGWGQTASQRVMVVDGGRQVGTVTLFAATNDGGPGRTAAMIAIVFAFLFFFWQLRRYVVWPLEAMGRAARQIARGDLEFTLPHSRVREVADVCEAFEAMGAGLRQSITQQAALEEERRFFIGAIAHDLRTPLFALRGYLVGLERGLATSPERAAHYVAMSRQRADHLDRLVSDLFAFTKAEYLGQAPHHERLALGPLLSRAVEGLQPQARAKGIALTSEGPEHSCTVEGDAHLIERAVENVLDNALRYTPAGGVIAVRWWAERERVAITVADTGPGIAPDDLPRLFDPLFRGEASRNRDTGGVGLGLPIARRILRAHGGDLTAANRETGGAVFTVWLPLLAPAASVEAPAPVGAHSDG